MRQTVILLVPEAAKQSANLDNILAKVGARWQHNIMPGTRVVGGRKLVQIRIDGELDGLVALLEKKLPLWSIVRMRRIKPDIAVEEVPAVDEEGKPVLDNRGRQRFERVKRFAVIRGRKTAEGDTLIKQHMIKRRDEEGKEVPFSGIVRLPHNANDDEYDYPETVEFL